MSYTSVSSVVERIGGLGYQSFGFTDNASFESYIARLVDRVSRLVDRYCGVPDGFFRGGYRGVRIYRGGEARMDRDGGISVVLPYTPIIEVASVKLNRGTDTDPSWVDTSYICIDAVVYIYGEPNLTLRESILVEYKAGYVDTPLDIVSVATESVASFLLEYLRFIRSERSDPPILQLKSTETLEGYRHIQLYTG